MLIAAICRACRGCGGGNQFDDDGEQDAQSDDDESGPIPGITILQRHDYRVVDDVAVMAAARAAYLRAWPDDDAAAAERDVTHLGRALYQLAHVDGWGSLDSVSGLAPTGAAIVVVHQEELLGRDPAQWPEDIFAAEGEVLYVQQDVFVV